MTVAVSFAVAHKPVEQPFAAPPPLPAAVADHAAARPRALHGAGGAPDAAGHLFAGQFDAAPRRGGARVIAAADAGETAVDESFTPKVLRELRRHPEQAVDKVLERLVGTASLLGDYQHPTIARVGDTETGGAAGDKLALCIGNATYTGRGLQPLPNALKDLGAMAAQMSSRGYQTTEVRDQNSGQLEADFRGAAAKAKPGSELVVYYAGHGLPDGLVGINYGHRDGPGPATQDVMANEIIKGSVEEASAKGSHLTVILDSCHSGAASDLVRREHRSQLSKQAQGAAADTGPIAAVLQGCNKLAEIYASSAGQLSLLIGDAAIEGMVAEPTPAKSTDEPEVPSSRWTAADHQRIVARFAERAWIEVLRPVLQGYCATLAKYGRRPPALPGKVTDFHAMAGWIDRIGGWAVMLLEEKQRPDPAAAGGKTLAAAAETP